MADLSTIDPILERICASQPFRQSHRLQRFLRYVTEWALQRPDEPLKEYAVAVAVYDKPSSFDSQSDPIVRVEAGRLRSRLNQYYSSAGLMDDVIIELPKGSYIPHFKTRNTKNQDAPYESLAVIPFQDDNEADITYLVNGLCEAVTRRLAQILKIRVTPWSLVLRAQNQIHDLEQRATYLGAHTLVTLRLVLHEDVYELHAEWLDPATKTHLWGAQYSRRLAELFGLEDDISFDLAGWLYPETDRVQETERRRPLTSNGRAYQLYLRARHLWNKRTADAMARATEYYRRAIDLDPGFALAYASMADCYLTLASFAFIPPNDSLPRAKAAASRALEIDPKLGEAKTVLACVSALYEWDWLQAQREFEQAMMLSPLYPVARQWYGACLCARRDFVAGRKFLKSALELDPLSPMIGTQLAVAHYLEHRYADAIRQCTSVLENDAHFWAALLFLGLSLLATGQVERAIDSMRAAVQLSADAPMAIAGLGHALALGGDRQEAAELLSHLSNRAAQEYVPAFWLALLCCSLGELEPALSHLERAVAERSPTLPFWLAVEPRLDPLRREPRFQQLLQVVGLIDLAQHSPPIQLQTPQ
jgi:tetratricopeptide (TPR) repeat protein